MGTVKNVLKKILPPPVNSFMREVNRIVALEEKNQTSIDKLAAKVEQQEEQIKNQNEIIAQQIKLLELQEKHMQQQAQIHEQQVQYMQSLNITLTNIDKYLHEQSSLTNKLLEKQSSTVKKHYDEQQRINKDMRARIDNTNKEITYHYFKGLHPDQYKDALVDWYYQKTGVHMDIDNPKTFNEKIQWLKLYDSTPEKTRLADKYLVREWVAEKIGKEYLIPLLGVYDKFDDIDFDALPNQFVMKANHGSGWNIVVKDKEKFDVNNAKWKFDSWMKKNFAFQAGLECHYKDINPKILVEEYIENGEFGLSDYKIWCFHGQPKFIQFVLGRNEVGNNLTGFYDLEWNKLPFSYKGKSYNVIVQKPEQLEQMIYLARVLCRGFKYVRVDFYLLNTGKIKFGEMTFTTMSGLCEFFPLKYDIEIGQFINLS